MGMLSCDCFSTSFRTCHTEDSGKPGGFEIYTDVNILGVHSWRNKRGDCFGAESFCLPVYYPKLQGLKYTAL
jgi:hypothetical protein